MQNILKNNGYSTVRQCGSHQVWSNGDITISIPVVKLRAVVANRLIKENNLRLR